MPTTADFESAYQRLNAPQKLVVDSIDGPVLVLAGPGTGKTQVLTVRIANILKNTDTEPSSVLALTFTEAAAKEMKERLIRLIGKDGYFVKIGTYHAFCAEIIDENPDRFSRAKGLAKVTELEKIQYINDILTQNSYGYLKTLNSPLFYNKDIRDSISTLKREGFSLPKFNELVTILREEFEIEKDSLGKTAFKEKEKLVNKNIDLLNIYEKYQSKLTENGRYDFDDMINWVVDSFETDPDFALKYQEEYQYILADEYQDTNSAQNRLLFALTSYWGENANIFVVGDPNQSIFRFQGASKENVIQFRKQFPVLQEISLTENYRSTSNILDVSAHLLGEKTLNPTVKFKNHQIKVAKFSSPILEDEFLVDTIKKKIRKGLKPKEIAVIVKENHDIDHLVSLFKHKKIPYRLQKGADVLQTSLVSQFLKILTVTTQLQGNVDDLDLFTVLNYPYFDLKPLSILKTARAAGKNRESLMDVLMDGRPDTDPQLVEVFQNFISWNSKSATHSLTDMFQMILQESGILKYILCLPQPIVELNRFGSLFDDAKNQAKAFPGLTLQGYIFNLNVMSENKIRLDEQQLIDDRDAVTLTTAHGSKGLEWRLVFIYKFADHYWGNKSKRQNIKLPPGIVNQDTDKDDKNAEERRLFYVAITRSKQQLYLTGSASYSGSASMIFPSLFMEELPKDKLLKIKTKQYEGKAEKILADRLASSPLPAISEGEEKYLEEIIKNFKLSPTALNTYLLCHYKFKLDHLYRIPRAKAPAMCFGTAAHFALENLYLELKNSGKLVSKEDFLRDFEASLRREILSDAEQKERLEHGKKILSAYYDFYEKEFAAPLFTEKNFGESLSSQIILDDIALSGKVDRIDLMSKEDKHVRLVDYKTGKVKSRNEIEGNTKTSRGDYLRQLVFYHLLAQLDKSFPYKVVSAQIDFLEPVDDRFKQESYQIDDGEIEKLKDVIRDSVKAIRDFNFERTTDYVACVRCDFLSHCWPDGLPVKVTDFEATE